MTTAREYAAIQSAMSAVLAESPDKLAAMKTEAFQRFWAELERLKNLSGGHVPTENPTPKI